MTRLVEPIDQTHVDCLAARDWVRYEFSVMRQIVDRWEPRPMPEGWRDEQP
jgi:hypothetical protein